MIDFTIGKERPISWELPEQISLESDWFALILETFTTKLPQYHNMKSYFTSKLIEHKNKYC